MLTYKIITKVGSREHNEDAVACVELGGNYCFVVADGLGGHGKGEVASQKVVEVFEREFRLGPEDNEGFLDNAFSNAQAEVLKMQQREGDKLGMKTTAVALSVINSAVRWGHVGDSRLYVFVKNKVKLRTLDHSVPQMLVLSGELKEKHISTHPDRNRLLRVIGVEWDSPRYELSDDMELDSCQAFLLCTDGFWECIEPKKMGKFLKKSKSVDQWLDMMTAEVEKNGKGQDMDNYTAIAVINGS